MGNNWFEKNGLVYGPGQGGHRIDHIMKHTRPADPDKPVHTIFKAKDQNEVLALIDEAWQNRTMIGADSGPKRAFYREFDREIGEQGERFLCIFTAKPRRNGRLFRIVTSYPAASAEDCRKR